MKFHKHEENAARRKWGDFPLSKRIKFKAGRILGALLPKLKKKVSAAPFENDDQLVNRIIRIGLYAEAFQQRDYSRLRAFLSGYWGKEAAAFHDGWNDRFERMFLAEDVCVIDDLAQQIVNREDKKAFDFLYEIGCGGGQVLKYLHDRFPQFQNLTGIDLGEEQIQKNRTAYSQERLEFVAADACEWISENAKPNSVILTNGGVFEYFLQSELETLFSHAARSLPPVVVCITETLATDHDLESETDSLVYGREMAFSHNYPHLLKSAGFKIVSCSERSGDSIDGGGRWIRLLAIAE